ncbi:MAG TPA: hypothetical protein PKA41_07935 [Verrucomicrobiota bacterium]|nr:hypothetical protein [Verrucomicrobiota bacterium]
MKSSATANPVLTGHAEKFMRAPGGFVGARIFPAFSSAAQSSDYYVFDAENHLGVPTGIRHAPGSGFKRILPKASDDNFACRDYGIEVPVPDTQRAKYRNQIDLDLSAARRLTDIIKINHEIRVVNLITSSVPSAAIQTKWNTANSNPIADVDAAREEIRKGIGVLPNTGVISRPMLNTLKVHSKLQEVFKYTTPGVLDEQKLANYFGLREILVADQVIASNQEGQAVTAADIWSSNFLLAHTNPGSDLMQLNLGRTFYWDEFGSVGADGVPIQVQTYRDEPVESDVHRARHFTDEKIVCSAAGYLLTGCL